MTGATASASLNELRGIIDSLNGLLDREASALRQGSFELLAAMQEEKRAHLAALDTFDAAPALAEDSPARAETLDELRRFRQRALVNGALMQELIRVREEGLAILAGGERESLSTGYGGQGGPEPRSHGCA